jgi:hypothetical protein
MVTGTPVSDSSSRAWRATAPHPPRTSLGGEARASPPVRHGSPEGEKVALDGGLPRHLVLGRPSRVAHSDFSRTSSATTRPTSRLGRADRRGPVGSDAREATPSSRRHEGSFPAVAASFRQRPRHFTYNGLPQHREPYASPSADATAARISIRDLRRCRSARHVFNKGWHYPQQRLVI